MPKHKISVIASGETDLDLIEAQLAGLDYETDIHISNSVGETIEAVKGGDVIINLAVRMPREVIREIDTAQAIVSFGHGFDRNDDEAATDQGVMLVNCAGFCTEEVSNHAIMLLLACAKNLAMLDKAVKSGRWTVGKTEAPPMPPIDGQTLGLVGLGNIARATARKAQAFGLATIGHDPYVQPWTAKEYKVPLVGSLEELASRSDFVSMHVPLNSETRKLVGEPFFKAMKPTAYFINTCRGQTVDEQALVRALQSGEIAGAGLDVFEQEPTPADNPLLEMENVVVTPHSAGGSTVAISTAHKRIGEETARILRGTYPMSLANPSVCAKIPVRPPAVNV